MVVGPFRPLVYDFLTLADTTPAHSIPLIPVLVTGIQPTRVCAAERLF